ncbi:MAG: hypothetical protein SPI77_00290 [Corynebacterium sp.]|nr:hypothetical protein [Corynebacterium sp.]
MFEPDTATGVATEGELRRFFPLAQEGAQVRAVVTWVREGGLADLDGLTPRSLVILASDRLSAAAADLVISHYPAAPFPTVVTGALPPYVGALDIVVVIGSDLEQQWTTEAISTAVNVGAVTITVGYPDELLSDAHLQPPDIPFAPGYSLAKQCACIAAALSGPGEHTAVMLDELARELDEEIAAVHPSRGAEVNPARHLAEQYQYRPIVHAGPAPLTRLIAEQWLRSGWVSAVMPARLIRDRLAAPEVEWTVIDWDAHGQEGITEVVDSDAASDLARALRYYVRAAAAPMMETEEQSVMESEEWKD